LPSMLIGAAVPVALALLVPVMDEVPVVNVGMSAAVEIVSAPAVVTDEASFVVDFAVSDEVPVAVLDPVEVPKEEALLDEPEELEELDELGELDELDESDESDESDELLPQPDLMMSMLE